MSIRMQIANTALRTFVKPTLTFLSLNNISEKNELLKKINGCIPAPRGFHYKPLEFNNFVGEKVLCMRTFEQHQHEHVILYFPGGAYITGDHVSHRNITTRLAHYTRASVVAIDYRKSPEHPYPHPVEDAVHSYERLLLEGYQPKNISFAGDSAGGNLVLSTLYHLKMKGLPMPSCATCISPWTDISGSGKTIQTRAISDPMLPASRLKEISDIYSNGLDLNDPRISPLNADVSGFPPISFHVGTREILLSDSVNMHRKLVEENGKHNSHLRVWENAPHVFQLWAGFIPQSSQSLKEIAQFMLKNWSMSLEVRDIPESQEIDIPLIDAL